jgi:hypothetical protein
MLQFGLTAMGALVTVGVGLRERTDPAVSAVVLLGLVPALAAFVTLDWARQAHVMMRIGNHLAALERRINGYAGGTPAMTWETSLRSEADSDRRRFPPHRRLFTVLLLFPLGGMAPGLETLAAQHNVGLVAAVVVIDIAVLGLAAWTYRGAELALEALVGLPIAPTRRRSVSSSSHSD